MEEGRRREGEEEFNGSIKRKRKKGREKKVKV